MIAFCVGKKIPTIVFSFFHKVSLYRVVIDIDKIGACFFISIFRCTAEWGLKYRPLFIAYNVVFPGVHCSINLGEIR